MRVLGLLAVLSAMATLGYGQVADDYFECEVSGDPHVVNFHQQRGNIPLPCFYRHSANRIKIGTTTDPFKEGFQEWDIDVYAASSLEPYHNRYFIHDVRLEVKAYTDVAGTLVVKASAVLELSGSDVEDYWNGVTNDASALWTMQSNTFQGWMIKTGYDNGRAWFKLLWQNNPPVEVSFRPVNRSDKIPQTEKPGLSVRIKQGILRTYPGSYFPGSLCSTVWDSRTYKEVKDTQSGETLESNRQLLLWAALRQQNSQPHSKCIDLFAAFQACSTWNKQRKAVKDCVSYTEAPKVKCLEPEGGVHTGRTVEALTKCFISSCETGTPQGIAAQIWLAATGC